MDLAAQRLRHALSPALWGFPAVASNERSPRPLTRVCRAELNGVFTGRYVL